jgi:hypothetical protein
VCVEVDGQAHPAESLEWTGEGAAFRSEHPLVLDDDVHVRLDWEDGLRTVLPAVVRSVTSAGRHHAVEVEVTAVEGEWGRFLAYIGPAFAAR